MIQFSASLEMLFSGAGTDVSPLFGALDRAFEHDHQLGCTRIVVSPELGFPGLGEPGSGRMCRVVLPGSGPR